MLKAFRDRVATLSIFILFLLLASSLAAERQTSSLQKPPTTRREVAEYFFLKSDSPELQMLKRGKSSWGWKNKGKDQPVASHRKGQSGIPLPGKEMVKKAMQPDQDEIQVLKEYHKQEALKRESEFRKEIGRPRVDPDNLTRCSESKTEARERVIPGYEDKPYTAPGAIIGPAIYDVLVLYPEDVPPDFDKAFGENTRVLRYYEDSSKRSRSVSKLGITCIPSRVRVMGKGSFSYEGLDAVKNYDSHPRGILDEQMEHMKDYW